jgi:glucose-1-phosphate cytidylyltransferase
MGVRLMLQRMEVVILCGGKGTRSYPFTEYMPKVMMPIKGRPIIVHLMEIYARQGFCDFVLAAGHRKEILYDYFDGRFTEWNIRIVDTGEESDTGERIRRCHPYVGDMFLATYGDGLGNVDLHELVAFHEASNGLATLTSVPLRSQYGTVLFNNEKRVMNFCEKPVIEDCWINAGFFAFKKTAFDHWTGSNLECHVLPALSKLGQLYVYQHTGFWKSMDTSKDQQEMESLFRAGNVPWMVECIPVAVRTASA